MKHLISKEKKDDQVFIDGELQKDNVEFRGGEDVEDEPTTKNKKNKNDTLEETKINDIYKGFSVGEDTIVRPLSKDERRELDKLKEEEEKKENEGSSEKEIKKHEIEIPEKDKKDVISFDDETMVASIRGSKRKIISEIVASEEAIRAEKKSENKKEEESQKTKLLEQAGESVKKKKKPIFMVAIIVVLFFAILEITDTFSDKKKKVKILPPSITFPTKLRFRDVKKSKELEKRGDKAYKKRGYTNTLNASKLYSTSLGYDFDNRNVLGKLILSYAELYRSSKKSYKDSEVLMKLIKIAERKIPNDINYITGAAIFFYNIGRSRSSINIIENFLKVNKTLEAKLIRYYMLALIAAGMENEARKAFEKLERLDKKTLEAYLGVIEYHMTHEKFDTAEKVLKNALRQYKTSVDLLLEYCKVLLHKEDFSTLLMLLNGIKDVDFDGSAYFYAQYLKYMGIISSFQNKKALAIRFFKKSLDIMENNELRKKLEILDSNDEKKREISSFINENKTLRLIKKSENALAQEDFNKAIAYAIKAVDLNSNYYPAIKQLAKVQRVRGHFQNAVDLLEKYIDKNNFSLDAKLDLIEVYIHAFSFNNVEKMMSKIVEISPSQEKKI